MKDIAFLRAVEGAELGVFGIPDIARIIGKTRNYARLFAKRLEDRGLLKRVEKSKYVLPASDPEVVASNIVRPSYVSFLSGLAYHHLTTQIPIALQIVAHKSKKDTYYNSTRITFIKLKGRRIFGYRREKLRGGFAFVGEPEKIVLDSLLLPKYCPMGESCEAMKSGMDVERMIDYALKMDSAVLLKRLGFMFELAGVDVHERLKPNLTPKYELLNPHLPAEGKKNEKWGLIVNEVF